MTNSISCAQVKVASLILPSKFVIFCQEYFAALLHSVFKRSVVDAERASKRSCSGAVFVFVILIISYMNTMMFLLVCCITDRDGFVYDC